MMCTEVFMRAPSSHSKWLLPLVLFLCILMVGLCVFRDYGVSVDEPTERLNDILSYVEMNRLLFRRIPPVFKQQAEEIDISTYADRYYGVAMRFPLMLIEDFHYETTGTPFSNPEIYHIRHLYVWLFYFGALISFFYLIRRLFGSQWIAAAGVLMVFLFGRYFASSFYDVKDIVFASLVIYSISCAERIFATNRQPRWCLLFAVVSALAVTSRVAGAVLDVLMIVLFLIEDLMKLRRKELRPKAIMSYLLICCAFPVYLLMTPLSWTDPVGYCIGEIATFSSYVSYHLSVYFADRYMQVNIGGHGTNPWDYTIRWIFLTVPVIVIILSCIGGMSFLIRTIKKTESSHAVRRTLWMTLSLLIGTLAYQVLCRPVMYDSWRHSYFLYPLMVLFAVYALHCAFEYKFFRFKFIGVALTLICLCYEGYQVVTLHPFEMVTMNSIGQRVATQYDGDYWGLSGKQAHEWILSQDNRPDIKIYGIPLNSGPGLFIPSLLTLKEEDSRRLRLAFMEYNPDYLEITSRAFTPSENYRLVKQFTVYRDVPVCSVYKRMEE